MNTIPYWCIFIILYRLCWDMKRCIFSQHICNQLCFNVFCLSQQKSDEEDFVEGGISENLTFLTFVNLKK